MKAVAAVVITGVGFVLGAVLGVSIGFLAGVWSGPGAAFTGALGLFKGAITGAAIGLTAATAVTGLTAGAISGYLLFKPTGLVKQFGDLSTKAKKMAESPALAGNSEILEEEKCPRP